MLVYLQGQYVDDSEAKISVFDHGFLYGDGIFEGIRLYENCVFKLDEHLERFEYSAKAIMLALPWTREEIAQVVCETCRKNQLQNGYIRLIATRGVGTLGLNPNLCDQPQLICIADSIQLYPVEYYTQGLKLTTVPTRRINPAALPPMIKSLNYLNNILAKIEALQQGYMEAIMLNDQGYIAECTGDNLFIIHRNRLYTPATSAGALKGITRQTALQIAQEMKLEVIEGDLTRYDVWCADECFLTGTAAELIPVVEVDGRTISTGQPGPITKEFLTRFHNKVTREGTHL